MITRTYTNYTLCILDNETGDEVSRHTMSNDVFLAWLKQSEDVMMGDGDEDHRMELMAGVDADTADLMGFGLGEGQYAEIDYSVKTEARQ